MSTPLQLLHITSHRYRGWSWFKKTLFGLSALVCGVSCFLFLTPAGSNIREKVAETVIMTQHREWAWLVVGANKRDQMVNDMDDQTERNAVVPIDPKKIDLQRKNRSMESLIKVEDISGPRWKGKKMYVMDPKAIRVVVPPKPGEGERISAMVERTGAIAGVNGGGFDDPEGLGNGFAPIGFIMSGGKVLFTSLEGKIPQHVVGFTAKGLMIVGKDSIDKLIEEHVQEAVSFYPRFIANGVALPTSGDGVQPRTAVGQRRDGVVIFIIIDGRQTQSLGATQQDVQDIFMKEGVENAGFLDGGASSELVIKGQGVVTKPSSRYGERRLPTGLLIFDHPSDYIATDVWRGLTHIDPGGAYDNPDFKNEQAQLRKEGKLLTPKPMPKESLISPKRSESPSAAEKSSNAEKAKTVVGSSTSPDPTPVSTPSHKPGATHSSTPLMKGTVSNTDSGDKETNHTGSLSKPTPSPTITTKSN
jgi:exopolysaccharide biosynthesis protein